MQAVREGEEMKRPVNMTVEVDDEKPQGWALQHPDGSLSSLYFFLLCEPNQETGDTIEAQFWRAMLLRQFRHRYGIEYSSSSKLHIDALASIKDSLEGCRMVPVWLFTTQTKDSL